MLAVLSVYAAAGPPLLAPRALSPPPFPSFSLPVPLCSPHLLCPRATLALFLHRCRAEAARRTSKVLPPPSPTPPSPSPFPGACPPRRGATSRSREARGVGAGGPPPPGGSPALTAAMS